MTSLLLLEAVDSDSVLELPDPDPYGREPGSHIGPPLELIKSPIHPGVPDEPLDDHD